MPKADLLTVGLSLLRCDREDQSLQQLKVRSSQRGEPFFSSSYAACGWTEVEWLNEQRNQ